MRFTIKAKLAVAFGLVIVLAIVWGILAIRDMGELNAAINQLIDGSAEKVKLGNQIETQFTNLAKAEKNMILADSDQLMDKYDSEIVKSRQNIKALQTSMRAIAHGGRQAGHRQVRRSNVDQYHRGCRTRCANWYAQYAEPGNRDNGKGRAAAAGPNTGRPARMRDRIAAAPVSTEVVKTLLAVTRMSDALRTAQRLEKDLVINTDEAMLQRYNEQHTAALGQIHQSRQELEESVVAQERPALRDIFVRYRSVDEAVAAGRRFGRGQFHHEGVSPVGGPRTAIARSRIGAARAYHGTQCTHDGGGAAPRTGDLCETPGW